MIKFGLIQIHIKKINMLAYWHTFSQHLMKKYLIMQLIKKKALFIFIISEFKTYKRNCGTQCAQINLQN